MNEEMIVNGCLTPLVELLERVPADARMTYEHSPTHHQMIPVGSLCHEAAALLRVSDPNERLREALEAARQFVVLFLAFDGRDRHTDRMEKTLDALNEMAVVVDAQIRSALSSLPQGED